MVQMIFHRRSCAWILFICLVLCYCNTAVAEEPIKSIHDHVIDGEFCRIDVNADVYEPDVDQVSSPVVYYEDALDLSIVNLVMPDYEIVNVDDTIQELANQNYIGFYSTTNPVFTAFIKGSPSDLTCPVDTFESTQMSGTEQAQRVIAQDTAERLNSLLIGANYNMTDVKFYAPTDEMPYGVCEYWFSQHIGVIPLHNRFVYMGTGHPDQVYMKVPGLRVCVSEGRIVRFELVYASHEEDTENTICLMNLEDFLMHLTREIDESPLEGVIHVNRITLEYTPIGVTEDIVNYRPSWCLYGQAGGIENVLIFDAGTGELLRH